MTTTFQTANTNLAPSDHVMDHHDDSTTPTTPRGATGTVPTRSDETASVRISAADITQSQNNIGIAGQRPLPGSPFQSQSGVESVSGSLSRGGSTRSTQEKHDGEMNVDDSGGEEDGSQEGGDDGADGDPNRPSKKKKPQRFFCTDFPPCTLSFTRSEHLARHIRKHTGERPFQCHCARRFSRLDNLRQHAQTVHVNEEIPGDSLAATGTRFQRQIRTDRVRPPGRARAGTGGSQGSHTRGHSRNLSTSSIGSTASNFSQNPEPRRRPPPLIMANDPNSRARLNIDTMSSPPTTPPNQYRGYPSQSPGDISTPTSATFSNGPTSPGFGSPMSAASRNGMGWGSRTPGRRLSVPSGQNPFQSPHGSTYPPPYFSPLAPATSSFSNNGSVFTSPTSSSYSFSRNEQNNPADADWRRRTWHPSTYSSYSRPATSGLSYYQTPDEPQPAFAMHATTAAGQTPRLPGIESFDHVQHRPSTPPRRGPSPMQIDPPQHQPINTGNRVFPPSGTSHHRSHVSWDASLHNTLHSNLTRIDVAHGTPPKDAAQWSQQTIGEIQYAASRPYSNAQSEGKPTTQVIVHQDRTHSGEHEPTTPRRQKRQGWYNGPLPNAPQTPQTLRTSPEDSSSSEGVPTPGTSATDFHPAIMHSNGYIEPHHPTMAPEAPQNVCAPQAPHPPHYRLPQDVRSQAPMAPMPPIQNNDMGRLEALVAVATSEENAATKSF